MMPLHTARRIWIGVGGLALLVASTSLAVATRPHKTALAGVYQQVDAATLEVGRGLYVDQCEPCHGDDGKGGGPAARFLETTPTDLTGDTWARMEAPTLEAIIEATAKGVPDTSMEPFEELLTEDEILAVAAYVLQAFNPGEGSR